jgi:hypothetical protein
MHLTLGQVGQIAGYVTLAVVASIFLAAFRNPFALSFINGLFVVCAVPFALLQDGARQLIRGLNWLSTKCAQALSHNTGQVSAWDVFGPFLYFVFLIVLVTGEAYIAIITLPQLLGGQEPNINPGLFAPTSAVLAVTIFLAIVAAAADLYGMTRFLRPFSQARGDLLMWLKRAALVALGLLALMAIFLGVFRAELVQLTSSALVDGITVVLFFLMLNVALVACGFALWYGPLATVVVVSGVLSIGVQALGFVLKAPILVFDKVAEFLVGIYDVLAQIGRVVWNYLSQLTKNKPWAVGRVPDYDPRRNVVEALEGILVALRRFTTP